MNSKRWIRFWVIIIMLIPIVGGFNYIIDPYGIYNTKYFKFNKIKQSEKMRLIKVIKTKEIKPKSIVLGTSRAEYGYDPNHAYFDKPSYNLANSGSSMYENRLNFEYALKQGNLKKVLLVLDYIMLNTKKQKSIPDYETYFNDKNIYSFLFSIDTLLDSILTIFGGENTSVYLDNGQRDHTLNWKNILKNGGHLATMHKDESSYYKNYPTNYTYKDTSKMSFPDFEKIVALAYKNDIELDIIFGPSHIRQWEAFDYYLGFNTWLQWKKDVVITTEKIAKIHNKKPYRIIDFSVYHTLTSEKVPVEKNIQMKYHWEASHYKNELGLIALDRLIGKNAFQDFGIELSFDNIDAHLKKQKRDRHKFIDIEKYKRDFEISRK